MRQLNTLVFAFLMLGGVVAILPIQQPTLPTSNSEIMTEVSHAQMRAILQGMGFEFTEKAFDDSSNFFIFQLNGYRVALLNHVKTMQLYSASSAKTTLANVNQWNSGYRFGRAYADNEGAPCLENDLSFEGGITKGAIEAFIKQFRTTLTFFNQFITQNALAAPNAPSSGSSTPNPAPTTTSPLRSYTKSRTATKRIKIPFGEYVLWIDESRWKQSKSDDVGVLTFNSTTGEVVAKVISNERGGMSEDALKDYALSISRQQDHNATMVLSEERVVNGRQVLVLQIDAMMASTQTRLYGYCFGGKSGFIQVWTFTPRSAFDNSFESSTEFLNGLEIAEHELPLSASTTQSEKDRVLLLNAAKMSVKYDSEKWKQKPSDEVGLYAFSHVSGDCHAIVTAERLAAPLDAFVDIALKNFRSMDPDVNIIVREKRMVNGVEVWFLKVQSDLNKIPMVYYGYYYGGKNGTVQVLTYTGRNLLHEYEKDLLEFLNGLLISE